MLLHSGVYQRSFRQISLDDVQAFDILTDPPKCQKERSADIPGSGCSRTSILRASPLDAKSGTLRERNSDPIPCKGRGNGNVGEEILAVEDDVADLVVGSAIGDSLVSRKFLSRPQLERINCKLCKRKSATWSLQPAYGGLVKRVWSNFQMAALYRPCRPIFSRGLHFTCR